MSIKNWLRFLAMGLVWGSTFFWVKIGLREVGPFSVVFYRILIATIALIAFYIFSRKRFPWKFWRLYLFLGFFNIAFSLILVSWSEKFISSGMASILNSTQPLVTAVLAAFLMKDEPLTLQRIIGIFIGFGGVLVLMSNRITEGTSNQILGIAAMMVAVFCYGISSIYARTHNDGVRPEDQSLGQMIFSMIFIIPSMLLIEPSFMIPVKPMSWVSFTFLGLLGSFFASITWYSLLNEIGPSRVSMITYMFPLIGVVLGAVALHETVDWRLLVGGLLVLGGIIVVNSKIKTSPQLVTIKNEHLEG